MSWGDRFRGRPVPFVHAAIRLRTVGMWAELAVYAGLPDVTVEAVRDRLLFLPD
jgi:hypothetical protein